MDERQNKILKIIVEEYIKSAKPVGSKSICETLNCSSATVRNEMSYFAILSRAIEINRKRQSFWEHQCL